MRWLVELLEEWAELPQRERDRKMRSLGWGLVAALPVLDEPKGSVG